MHKNFFQFLWLSVLLLAGGPLFAQYQFTELAAVKTTPVKNQARTGTCWAFGTTSFLESEILRIKGIETDLSEMFSVRNTYTERIRDYYLRFGKGNLGPGGVCHTLTNTVKKYGLVPETVYNGIHYDSPFHDHSALQKYINDICALNLKEKIKSPQSEQLMQALMDIYLGPLPETFTIEGKEYTPLSYCSYLGLNLDDYIEITSFTHHPFYTRCTVEIPDNWEYDHNYYNLPLDEMMRTAEYALRHGYSIAWDGDVSEKGFRQGYGLAILPEGTEEEREEAYKFENPLPEINVTQELRQQMFENFITTDDHIMHLTGLLKDQNGTLYYVTKNSWGPTGKYPGYIYMSENYVRAKTIALMLHKDAVPEDLREKLGF